jgi:hypothetical protein
MRGENPVLPSTILRQKDLEEITIYSRHHTESCHSKILSLSHCSRTTSGSHSKPLESEISRDGAESSEEVSAASSHSALPTDAVLSSEDAESDESLSEEERAGTKEIGRGTTKTKRRKGSDTNSMSLPCLPRSCCVPGIISPILSSENDEIPHSSELAMVSAAEEGGSDSPDPKSIQDPSIQAKIPEDPKDKIAGKERESRDGC